MRNIIAYADKTNMPGIDDNSELSRSYSQGYVKLFNSMVSNSDIRGDENPQNKGPITISNSTLDGTTLHCTPNSGLYHVLNSQAKEGSVIHGSYFSNSKLGEFSTIDQTDAEKSTIGRLSYVSRDEKLDDEKIEDGKIIIQRGGFELIKDIPSSYVNEAIGKRKELREKYLKGRLDEYSDIESAEGYLHPYAAVIDTVTSNRNFIAQNSYTEDSFLGTGTNIQEGCIADFIVADEYNIFAHNAIASNVRMGDNNFLMFNALAEYAILGNNVILLPNTTVEGDNQNQIELGPGIYFGDITSQQAADKNKITFDEIKRTNAGKEFYDNLANRINHILELNGGLKGISGHAQNHRKLEFERI